MVYKIHLLMLYADKKVILLIFSTFFENWRYLYARQVESS